MDPRDGSITLADYIEQYWAPGMAGAPKTRDGQDRRVRLHIVPHLGYLPLRQVTAVELRGYIVGLQTMVSSIDYRRSILGELSGILETAVDDRRIARNPMRSKSVRWPKASKGRRDAWPLRTAFQVRGVISDRHRIAVVLGVGCGLRRGEVFGLSPEDIHVLRHTNASAMLEAGESVVTLARWPVTGVAVPSTRCSTAWGRGLGRTAETSQILPRSDRGGSSRSGLRSLPWISRSGRRIAWGNAPRSHRDPLCHALA